MFCAFNQTGFLCSSRDFHAYDWFKSAKNWNQDRSLFLVTDQIVGEKYPKLIKRKDKVIPLIVLDRFLFPTQSAFANLWRNFLKAAVFPFQVLLLRKIASLFPGTLWHAHSMYYCWLAWAAHLPFIAIPQGADIYSKPKKSAVYRFLAQKSLRTALVVCVDSHMMASELKRLFRLRSVIVQNGVLSHQLAQKTRRAYPKNTKWEILSIRGITPNFNLSTVLLARNKTQKLKKLRISFTFPYAEDQEILKIKRLLRPQDQIFGTISKSKMIQKIRTCLCAISIPTFDSSPRSVYEAIFSGTPVICTHQSYVQQLPRCMAARLIPVKTSEPQWLEKAVQQALKIRRIKPSFTKAALNEFDQNKCFQRLSTSC